MTSTINGLKLTDGDGVRDCVRAPEIPPQALIGPESGEESAFTRVHTRAIPDSKEIDKATAGTAVRNFVSQHAGEALDAVKHSWLLTEVPLTAGEAWRDVLPPPGGSKPMWLAKTTAGLFRALVVSLLHLFLLAVDTRMRAAVAMLLTAVTVAAAYAARHL